MLTIRPETEPAIRWARDVSDAIDDTAWRLFRHRARARVTLENCLEHLRTYGCETNSPFAPIDVEKCETLISHERGSMFLWSCRRAGQSSPWIIGGMCLTLPKGLDTLLDCNPLQPADVVRNTLLIGQHDELVLEALTWSTHT